MAAIAYILLILICIVLNAFFAGSEAALTHLNRLRLRHLVECGDKKAIMISNFLTTEGGFLGTTLVGTNISVIVGSALATQLFAKYFSRNAALLSTMTMTALVLILGEVVPKTIFRQSSNAISPKIIIPLKVMSRALYPLIFLVTRITDFVLRPSKMRDQSERKPFLTKKDIELILKARRPVEIGIPDERTLIQRIFKLGRTHIGAIMTLLNSAVLVKATDPVEELKTLASRTRFSRFPVYENTIHNIIGTVNIYDVLFSRDEKAQIGEYLQKPFFVSSKEPVDEILTELRKKKKPMGIVIDDHGACIGLVTIEDLVEEIVGEIEG